MCGGGPVSSFVSDLVQGAGDTLASIKGYIANGLNPAIATNAELTKTTLQLSAVTGQSSAEMAAFWAGIQRGSKLITSDFTNLGNAFTSFNASAEKSGVIGTISFNQVKEAISFVGTALLIVNIIFPKNEVCCLKKFVVCSYWHCCDSIVIHCH